MLSFYKGEKKNTLKRIVDQLVEEKQADSLKEFIEILSKYIGSNPNTHIPKLFEIPNKLLEYANEALSRRK